MLSLHYHQFECTINCDAATRKIKFPTLLTQSFSKLLGKIQKYYREEKATIGKPEELSSEESSELRPKRGVIHLYNMVSCATACNPLIYKGYGCFCGFLGSGRPVDGIDRYTKANQRLNKSTREGFPVLFGLVFL